MKKILPAGTYFIGDPCYAFQDSEDWSQVLNETNYFAKATVFKGAHIAGENTAYGDGEYESNTGTNFSVDAGLIGAVELVGEISDSIRAELESLGEIVTFNESFMVSYNAGTIQIGHIEVYTSFDTTEEMDSFDDYDEDDIQYGASDLD